MKKRLMPFLLFFVACMVNMSANETVYWEFVKSFSSTLRNVYTIGADNVYVVGDIGLIAQSPDRGKNWNIQRFTYNLDDILNDVYFVSNDTGFVVGTNGNILKTTNAGVTWTKCNSGTTQNMNAVAGTGINNIWAVGDYGTVIKSSNGGQTWNPVSITTQTPNFSDIGFKNRKGYIVGNKGSIYRTLDEGDSWAQQTSIEEYTGNEQFKSLSVTENMAFVDAAYYNAVMYKDSNNTWQKHNVSVSNNYGNYIFFDRISSVFLTDDKGFCAAIEMMITTGGSIYDFGIIYVFKTDDGGSTWSIFSEGSNNPVSTNWIIGEYNVTMAFANIDTGYLVSGHRMYRIPFVGDIDAGFYDGFNNPKQNIKFSDNGTYVEVYCPVKTISDIIITSISGQTVFQQNNNNSNEITLNTSSLNKGFYIFQINLDDNTEWSVKWIKH